MHQWPFVAWLRMLLVAALVIPSFASAHDIPNKMSIEALAKQEDDQLHLLVRVPLVMLLNLNLPKRGTGFLALDQMEEPMQRAAAAVARDVKIKESGAPLAFEVAGARISPLSDKSFSDFDAALANIGGPPLPPETQVFWNQGYFDVHYAYSSVSNASDLSLAFTVPPGLRNILSMNLVFISEDGSSRAFHIDGDTGAVHLDPDWWRATWDFGVHGFWHIFEGIDHLLFLACLVVPFRFNQLWQVIGIVTSFTIAHSVTISAGALGLAPQSAWFPPFIELAIAVSIIYMAMENLFGADPRWRWLVAGLFGFLHGYGFSFALQESMQFSGSHFGLALLSYNLGIEVGQVIFVVILVGALEYLPKSPTVTRYLTILVSLIAGHMAWHWAEDRFEALSATGALDLDGLTDTSLVWIVVIFAASMAALWIKRRGIGGRAIE